MPLDPRSPVLVGLHQLEQRVDDPLEGDEPLEMMIRAAECAAEDAGSRRLLENAEVVWVSRGRWHYDDPARAVAARVGGIEAHRQLGAGVGHSHQRWQPSPEQRGSNDGSGIGGQQEQGTGRHGGTLLKERAIMPCASDQVKL